MILCRYCIPTTDDRPITFAEKKFFNECGTGLGRRHPYQYTTMEDNCPKYRWFSCGPRRSFSTFLKSNKWWRMVLASPRRCSKRPKKPGSILKTIFIKTLLNSNTLQRHLWHFEVSVTFTLMYHFFYVLFTFFGAGMHEAGGNCNELIKETTDALSSKELQQLFLSTQKNNLDICGEYAIER